MKTPVVLNVNGKNYHKLKMHFVLKKRNMGALSSIEDPYGLGVWSLNTTFQEKEPVLLKGMADSRSVVSV